MIPRKLFVIGILGAAALCAQQPPSVSLSPSSGSGSSQTFTLASSSASGWQNIAYQTFLFNWGLDAAGACYVLVYPASGTVYLSADTGWTYGNQWLYSGTLGASGTIRNSECQINLASSSTSGSGNTVTTSLAITFEAGLPGPQEVFLWAGDNSGLQGGGQVGTWTTSSVSNQPPTLTSVLPSSGTGLAQTFSFTSSSVNGSSYLMEYQILFNTSLNPNAQSACHLWYLRADNILYLVDDAADAMAWAAVGMPGTLSNSQCSINTGASTAVGAGNNLTLNLAITFNPNWAGTKYSYFIAWDRQTQQAGWSQMSSWTVGAPSIVDPRRTGILTSGSYWGGGGEQIDTLSGNLNFSLPLLKPQSRTGQTIPVSLTYNSQNWEQQNGVNVQVGHDVGYGFGWQFMLGSIRPVYAITQTYGGIDHYVYTDGSGAQYSLNVNSSNVWSSTQGIYVWFDANANVLHFRDGSWWSMGCTSSSGEPDYDTMYPTLIEDVNGNQIAISYLPGVGIPISPSNTSARINTISDPRDSSPSYPTYAATYNSDSPVPHLTQIVSYIAPSESYNFTYTGAALSPPFGYDANYAGLTTTHLASVAPPIYLPYQFTYDTAGAGELTQATFPYGGHLRWSYGNDPYAAGRVLRAVGTRYLAADSAGATEWSYPISRDNASSASLHSTTTLSDASGVGAKTWNFDTAGRVSSFVQSASAGGAVLQSDSYGWAQDPAGNPYIASKSTVTGSQTALTTQTLDQYGNVTQSVIYPYNNTSTPLKTYNNTYLNSSTYTSHYVLNRLVSTALTTGGTTITLTNNAYDGPFVSLSSPYPPVPGCSSAIPPGTTGPTNLFDSSPPIPASARGNLYWTATPAGNTSIYRFSWGTVAGVTGSNGACTSTIPDASTNYSAPTTITNQNYSTAISYNSWLGITQTTGANGEQLSMTYDSSGRPATATSAYGAVTRYTYSNSAPFTQTQTGPNGVTTTTLDGLGRAIRVARGDANGTYSYTDTVYAPCACSPLAKIQQVSQPYVPGSSSIYWTVYTYDGLGRTLTVRQPDGASTTTYSYSGNQSTVWDPAGKWKQFTTDVSGNLTTVLEPDPANQPSGTLATNYSYDWMNHVTGVTMPRGSTTQTRTFVYDNAGRLFSATNPENGTATYAYNSDNTLARKHDAKGQDTTYAYDSYKRLTGVYRYPQGINGSQGEDLTQRVTYIYDLNPGFSQYAWGRLAAVQYGSAYTEMYSYHPAGGVTAKQLLVNAPFQYDGGNGQGSGQVEVDYTYNSAGQIASLTYPMGVASDPNTGAGVPYSDTLTYSYDSMGRPSSVATNDYNLTSAVGGPVNLAVAHYDYAGRLSSMYTFIHLVNSTADYSLQTRSYNVNGQLDGLGWAWDQQAGGMQYVYSPTQNNGQITQAVDTLSGETIVYQYDALKRLASASANPISGSSAPQWGQSFQYDGFGNLTGKTLNGSAAPIPVNAATNQLSNAYYDLNGNMTSGAGASFGYDVANRMTSATEYSGGQEIFAYAPDGKQIFKSQCGFYFNTPTANGLEGSCPMEFVLYGAYGEKLTVFNIAASRPANSYTWNFVFLPMGANVRFAGQLIQSDSGAVVQDRLGSNRAGGAQYYPYGEEVISTTNDRVKFGTYTRDGYTGLDYADQRYYASAYGRFNTPDPYMAGGAASGSVSNPSDPASWNRYAYTRGDPINRLDLTGRDDCDPESDGFLACEDGEASDFTGGGPVYYGECAYIADGLLSVGSLPCVSDGMGGVVLAQSAQSSPPPAPDCFAQLKDRPVNDPLASLADAYHSFWWIQDASGLQEIISGGPGGIKNKYLNIFITPGQSAGADNAGDTTVWSSGDSSAVCSEVSALEAAANGYKTNWNDKIVYLFWPGPNSNSLADYLGQSAGFSGISVPFNLYGWSMPIPFPRRGSGKTPRILSKQRW